VCKIDFESKAAHTQFMNDSEELKSSMTDVEWIELQKLMKTRLDKENQINQSMISKKNGEVLI